MMLSYLPRAGAISSGKFFTIANSSFAIESTKIMTCHEGRLQNGYFTPEKMAAPSGPYPTSTYPTMNGRAMARKPMPPAG